MQRRQFSRQEWGDATNSKRSYLDQRFKEQDDLCFYKVAIFQFTFNHPYSLFIQYQIDLFYNLPSQDDLD